LGWTASGHDEFSDQSGAHIPFTSERAGRIRRVRSVELTTTTSTYNATVSDADEGLVVVKSTGKNAAAGRFVPLQAVDSPSLLERAILQPSADEVFETALRMVGSPPSRAARPSTGRRCASSSATNAACRPIIPTRTFG
jgi:hypothetical protein